MVAYDSPVWFYVFLVPVFTALGVCICVLAWSLYHEVTRGDRP